MYLVQIGADTYVGPLGVRTSKWRTAYKFKTKAHADRVAKRCAEAFTGLSVNRIGPFKEGFVP